eukprot:4796577-Pleurochrysis_carterae.AAC.1
MANTEMAGPGGGGETQVRGAEQWAGLNTQEGGDPPLFQTPPVSAETSAAILARARRTERSRP